MDDFSYYETLCTSCRFKNICRARPVYCERLSEVIKSDVRTPSPEVLKTDVSWFGNEAFKKYLEDQDE